MVQSDKAAGRADEGEEIDRIMKEIEDLEKKMDTEVPAEAPAALEPTAVPAPPVEEEPEAFAPPAKVVPMRPSAYPVEASDAESLAETDAVPARDEPLVRDHASTSHGGLALKIGGCTEVSLEFTRSGMTVSLSCSDDGLCITTDQGAEFRIPMKRSA